MVALADKNPDAAVFHCVARCMDADGHELPQMAGAQPGNIHSMYHTLLEANFLLPSTMLIRRSALIAVGGFYPSQAQKQGSEDWDLWLRMASTYRFVGIADCLVNYRLHSASISSNTNARQAALRTIVERHFGPEAGDPQTWTHEKRIAYGGLYRHEVITSVLRQGNWEQAKTSLQRGLHVNPALASNVDLFYELALGEQPLGYRNTSHELKFEQNATGVIDMLTAIFDSPEHPELNGIHHRTFATAYYALGLVAYNLNKRPSSRHYLLNAARQSPPLFRDRRFVGTLLKTFVSQNLLKRLKSISPFV
jgi:hypothetical protein